MRKNPPEITAERLREVLSYDPDTGVFIWKISTSQLRAGAIAACKTSKGYIRIKIDRQTYAAHRLAWFYVHGEWPKNQLDHRNGIRDANWIANLREATNAENAQNRARRRDNKSGHPGIAWSTRERRWKVSIKAHGQARCVGSFEDLDKAVECRKAAKASLHEFQPFDREVTL